MSICSLAGKEPPDCYICKHRYNIPGDAHSQCRHPSASIIDLLGIHLGVGNSLGVTGNQFGISKGWFMWPMNYDPIWLRSCNGFEDKNGKAERDTRCEEPGEAS